MKKRFSDVLGSKAFAQDYDTALTPLLFLSTAAWGWREYLNHLESQVYALVGTLSASSLSSAEI